MAKNESYYSGEKYNLLAKKQTKIGKKLNSQNALFNQTTIDIILSRRIIYLFR